MRIEDVEELLFRSSQRGVHAPEELVGKLSMEEGYLVQMGLLRRHEEAGDLQVGWKVGLTAKAIQAQLNYHEPVFGYLLRSGHHSSGTVFDFPTLINPGFENEICISIGKKLAGPGVTFEQARDCISHVAPALEIVERRSGIPMDFPLVMADNGQQKGFVTGAAVPLQDLNLAEVSVEVFVNGLSMERASGAAVLGNPVASVAWLANKLVKFGRHLEPGELIMSGSFTKQYAINSGEEVEARFHPVGTVTANFS